MDLKKAKNALIPKTKCTTLGDYVVDIFLSWGLILFFGYHCVTDLPENLYLK